MLASMRKMSALIISALVFCLVLGAALPLPGAAAGQSGVTLDWVRNFGGNVYEGLRLDDIPVADREGNACVTCEDGYLYCVRPDRTLKWRINLGQRGVAGKTGGVSPVFDGQGNAYIGSGDGNVYAVGPDGNILWTFKMAGEVATGTSPALAPDGALYAATNNGILYALDSKDGSKKWERRVKGLWSCNTPVVSPLDGAVYVGSYNWVSAVKPDGDVKWERNLMNLGDGYKRYVYMHGVNGGTRYEKRMAAGADGALYLITTNFPGDKWTDLNKNRLYALNPADGSDRWHLDINQHLGSPAVWQDTLYCKTADNRLHALSAATGAEKWAYKAEDELYWGDEIRSAPAVGPDGTVYVPMGSNLHALTPGGEKKWSSAGGQYRIDTVSRPGPRGELYCVAGGPRLLKFTDHSLTQVPDKLELSDQDFALLPGGQYAPQVSLRDSYGRPMDTAGLWWASGNPGAAAVDANGRVAALAEGSAIITVFHPDNFGLAAVARVEVLPGTGGVRLEITPAAPEVAVGRQTALQAALLAPGGKLIKGETLEWTSAALPVATVSADGKVAGRQAGYAVIKARAKGHPEVRAEVTVAVGNVEIEKATLQDIQRAIAGTAGYYARQGRPGDWAAFALNAAGQDVGSYTSGGQTYLQKLAEKIKTTGVGSLMTDYERTTLALVSAGGDPTGFEGVNFIDTIAKWPNLGQGINAAIWGLIALDGASAVIPPDAKNTRESLVDYILANRSGDGWAFGGGITPDVDMTGMGLYALAPYRDRPAVKAAGEKAIRWLSENQLDDGKFGSWGTVNSESCSQAIMGLTAWGVDPQGPLFTKKNGNAVTALLSYHTDTGMFKHVSAPDPCFATDQGLEALAALQEFFQTGRSTIWYKIRPAGASPVEITALEISPDGVEIEPGKSIGLGVKNQAGLNVDGAKVDWSVSDTTVAGIDAAGRVTALKEGTVDIIAALKENPGVRDQARLTVVGRDFEIAKVASSGIVSGPGKNLAVSVKNISGAEKSAVFIITLYEKNTRKILHQAYIAKDFATGQTHVVSGGFSVPAEGAYETKVMVWNGWLKGRPLTEAIVE